MKIAATRDYQSVVLSVAFHLDAFTFVLHSGVRSLQEIRFKAKYKGICTELKAADDVEVFRY